MKPLNANYYKEAKSHEFSFPGIMKEACAPPLHTASQRSTGLALPSPALFKFVSNSLSSVKMKKKKKRKGNIVVV